MNQIFNNIFNPFENNTDKFLRITGVVSFLLLIFLSYQWHFVSDGIIQMHTSDPKPIWKVFAINSFNVLSLSLVMFLFGKIAYSKTRFIDVFNVVLFIQIVLLIIALLLFNPYTQEKLEVITNAIEKNDLMLNEVPMIILNITALFAILALMMMVFFFYLLVKGMKIAINSQKTYHSIIIVGLTIVLDLIIKNLHIYL